MGKDLKPLKEIRGKCYSLFFIFCCLFPSAIEDRTQILSYFRVPLKKKKKAGLDYIFIRKMERACFGARFCVEFFHNICFLLDDVIPS
jgi:hypothetical protein